MGIIAPLELSRRREVVRLANEIFESGAHYLWGANGNGQVSTDGVVRMRPNSIGASDAEPTYLFAAYRYGLGGVARPIDYVCAGRPHKTSIHERHPPRVNTVAEANALHAQGTPHLWKRFYRDGDTVNPNVRDDNKHCFGESCIGKLHFDCAGFVKHCFRQTLGIPIGSMRSRSPLVWEPGMNGIRLLRDFDLYPGDLLYTRDGHHVGIATGRTEYAAASPNHALHAYYAMDGVVRTPIAPSGWVKVYRWNHWG